MASATPARKIVRWAYDLANSSLGSPPHIDPSLNDATFESDVGSDGGGLAYVNAQLLAHGFAHGDGLDLSGLDSGSAKTVVKCIMGLLSQRANDVSRTEDLTTKYRNLSYDHERLLSLHRTQLEKTARAEQDTQRFKARLAVVQRELATVESQKKAALADLSRTRTSLQYLRTTSQQELRRLEKDKQTFSDRFTKVSDAQLHLGGATAGFYFSTGQAANAVVLDGTSVGGGAGVLETSLKNAEAARQQLMTENDELREVLLAAANRLQGLTQDAAALRLGPDATPVELPALTAAEVFSPPTSTLSNAHNAHAKLTSMTNDLRDALTQLASDISAAPAPPTAQDREATEKLQANVERMQGVIDKLTAELEQAKAESATFAAQSQALFDRFASDENFTGKASQGEAEMSFDITGAAGRDELQERLEEQQAQLDEERRKFTESAVLLGRQRAELEAQRLAFLEEKRSWQVQQILAELPPTPVPAGGSPIRAGASKPTPVPLPASKPFPSSSLEALLRPQIPSEQPTGDAEAVEEAPLPTKAKSPRKSFSPPHQKRVSFAVGGPTSPLKRKSPPRHQRRLSASPLLETPGRAGIFPRRGVKHAFSPARPSPLSRIMMLADDSSMMEGVPEAENENENEDDYVSEEECARQEQDEQDEMFPALPSAQRSPTRISFPPMPTSLAQELKLGASGQRSVAARTSFPPTSGPLVSFDFAKELEAAVSRPSSPSPEPSVAQSTRPPSRPTLADSSDEDLRIVKGTAGANKENKRPRGAPPAAPVPGPSKVAPAAKPRVPLSPRKMKAKEKPGPAAAPAKTAAAKHVAAPAPASAATVTKRISPPPAATAKRISPVPPATTATAPTKRVSPVGTATTSKPATTKSAAARVVPAKTMGAKRVPVTGPSGWR